MHRSITDDLASKVVTETANLSELAEESGVSYNVLYNLRTRLLHARDVQIMIVTVGELATGAITVNDLRDDGEKMGAMRRLTQSSGLLLKKYGIGEEI